MVGPSSTISKLLLSILLLTIIYYVWMDINLFLRIENYPIERNYNVTSVPTSALPALGNTIVETTTVIMYADNGLGGGGGGAGSSAITTNNINVIQSTQKTKIINYEDETWVTCDINPLCHITVKALMLDHTNHYIFAPMATIFDNVFKLSESNFITPNMISFFHVFIAIAAGKLIASDNLGYRRFGVVLFQFRTFLDDLDGHVARAKKHIKGERSEIGTSGYYIDGICDGLGCIALMIGIFVYLKNNPPRRGYTQLQAILPISEQKNSDSGVIYKVKVTTKKVVRKVLCFSGQLLLSSTAWNRYIALYQDMLERNDVTIKQYYRQTFIFTSKWFFSVAWLWRIFNVHALLHCVLLSIFCDKLWEFLRMIQYAGFVALLVIICFTEMHVLEVQNFIFKSLTGNNTSL